MSDTKGNVDEDVGVDVPVVSEEENQPSNVEVNETRDDLCNVTVEVRGVQSESGVEEREPRVGNEQVSVKTAEEVSNDGKTRVSETPGLRTDVDGDRDNPTSISHLGIDESTKDVEMGGSLAEFPKEPTADAKEEITSKLPQSTYSGDIETLPTKPDEAQPVTLTASSFDKPDFTTPTGNGNSDSKQSFLWDDTCEGNESGTEDEQSAFLKELESFFKERGVDFKPPKFYGGGLNLLKLWRSVTKLGGYDKVTLCKLWRQVGESFRPPKTCTTVSWTFRGFYEKALLDYERHNANGGELNIPVASLSEPMNVDIQGPGSGRARRDAAARAMQGWHSQRLLDSGDHVDKDKNSVPLQRREKQPGPGGLLKRKKPFYEEHIVKATRTKVSKPQLDTAVIDIGPPADWVKINVQKTKDCFEVYALVPGLLREEVRVQSDPAGRLVISGEPRDADNPWGATPFKKVVSLPSRIDSVQTSAVVTLHGQLFIRVPFELVD